MKRKYDAASVEWALSTIASEVPGAFVGMDVIVGFPGETKEDFADTYQRLEKLPWTRIHVFPYSERPGTKAAAFDGVVKREERLLRSQRLRELSTARFEQMARAQIGSVKKVLILKAPGRGAEGLSHDYWPVKLDGESGGPLSGSLSGQVIEVEITGYDDSSESRMEGVLRGKRRGGV
jgi:threonylcarbamoyladenosine tRNA methylthiotransferase MtaB